jgi:hypothetical protein
MKLSFTEETERGNYAPCRSYSAIQSTHTENIAPTPVSPTSPLYLNLEEEKIWKEK